MGITLRDYQSDCIDRTRDALRKHKRVLLQSPTGSGKTAMAAFMASQTTVKQKRIYFICHRRELIAQTAGTFASVGLDHSFIAAGLDYDPVKQIQICSVDTLKNRLDIVPVPDLCVWDECHHLGADGWAKIQSRFNCYHVGLSATPQRLDGKGLDDRFDFLVRGPSVAWLIEQGYLAKYRLFSVPGVDLTGVKTKMGEYSKPESEQAMDKPGITGDIISHWQRLAPDRLTIGFAVSIKHSQHMAELFNDAGVPSAHIDGKTKPENRTAILSDLADGIIRVVWNVGLFGEGFDIAANSGKDVTIGCVIDAAPIQAMGVWLQRCGRVLRPQDDPAIILDHAGNALRHGLPDQHREWTLEGRTKAQRKSDEADIQMRQCGECFMCHPPAPQCPSCGYVYQTQGRTIEERAGELIELEKMQIKQDEQNETKQARTLQDLIALAKKRKYKNPVKWAQYKLNGRKQAHARYRR